MSELSQRLANLSPAKRKLLEQRLRQGPEAGEPVAIVGMGCRFPGAPNPEAFWRLIVEGRDATSEVPASRWNVEELYDPTGEVAGKTMVRWGGFIEGVDQFDPLFFGITPREAKKMDPQQRLLLEVAWEALEQGGLAPERMSGSATGVFVGIGAADYAKIPYQSSDYLQQIDPHIGTGNALSIAANRISYSLDLHGPSLAVDTACSSALVCVHLAVRSLRLRECNAALAGGVNLILTPETMIAFSKARMLSPDGRCRPFDAAANGYVRGEGCGLVVLKRLADATRDGDNILAVIRGTAVNQDGRTSGITAPNALSQQAVIRAALADAGLTTERVNYIEAHGTGTPLGDPIELQSLAKLFPRRAANDPTCYVTSVKANIGHTETVSGVAGLVKVLLMMQHGCIPGQLHLHQINPNISLAGTRLEIPTAPRAWEVKDGTRTAGISSFGFGGTNAHIIVEEAAAVLPSPHAEQGADVSAILPSPLAGEGSGVRGEGVADRPRHVLALSARSEAALKTLAGQYAERLGLLAAAEPASRLLGDFCFSAATGRSHFNHRLAIVADNSEKLQKQLQAFHDGPTPRDVKAGQVRIALRPRIGLLFTGQGSQYVGMGRGLYDTQPVFRQALDRCAEILRGELPEPLLDVLYPQAGRPSPLDQTAYTQPALFAIEYAMAMLWQAWGIQPDVVLGHSVGEYTAACVAGVFSLEDGLRLIAGRARLMQQLPAGGSMAAVLAPAARVLEALAAYEGRVSIAAANGPENTVISGEAEAVRAIVEKFLATGVRAQPLAVSHAFHSALMEPMLDEFERLAASITCQRPRVPIVSNLTGRLLLEEPPDAKYWRNHVRNAVQFAAGMQVMAEQDLHVLVEVGPQPTLIGMGRRCIPDCKATWLPSLRKGRDDWETLLESLAELYVLGAKINWPSFDAPWPRRRVPLPTYPFERSRHWFDIPAGGGARGLSAAVHSGPVVHPLLGSRLPAALETTLFAVRLSSNSPKYLLDHQVQGSPVVPAAAYVEQGLAAAQQAFGPGPHALENVSIQQAMFLAVGMARDVQVTLSAERGGECTFETYSTLADSDEAKRRWTLHACGTLRHAGATAATPRAIDLEDVRRRAVDVKTSGEFYAQIAARGLAYGPAFQVLADLRRSDRDALAAVSLPEQVRKELPQYHLHPALLDACFQSMAGAVPLEPDGGYSPFTYMPTAVRRVVMHAALTETMYTYAVRTSADDRPSPESVEGDVYLVDDAGRVLVELSGVRVQRVGRGPAAAEEVDPRQWLYRVTWQPSPLPTALREGRGEQQPWLIFADRLGVADALLETFAARGQRAIRVLPGDRFASAASDPTLGPDVYRINPLDANDYGRLLEAAIGLPSPHAGEGTLQGVVHLWSLGIELAEAAAGDCPDFRSTKMGLSLSASLDDLRRLGCGSVLLLLQQLTRSKAARPPALWLVTRGAQPAGSETAEVAAPGQSPLWGMGRVAAMEHPEQHCRLIDLDPAAEADDAASLLAGELAAEADEDQIAYRGTQRYVARLATAADLLPAEGAAVAGAVPAEGPFRLRLGTPGSFDSLRFEPFVRRQPGPGQVEIEVHAAGLNFSDVLKAMGLYPGLTDAIVPLGIECSGVVTALGPGVDRFRVGEAVLGVAPYSFASHAITAEYALVAKPESLADDEAATIPITFLTAYYGLVSLAHVQAGERVLIHAGAGGVGLAAIQIAQHLGAEVFATAGSETKRDFLRALGVKHVMSSRSLEFADEIMQITDRRGVDVVLNSLPGDAIPKSLAVLSAYGRFLEIGKTDIYQNRMIGLLPFQDNLSYFAIDLDRMLRQKPELIRRLFAEVIEHFQRGVYRPLALTQFPIADTVAAFRYMAQRKNIGKVVVSLEDRPAGEAAEAGNVGPVRAEGTYLITGGLGALGLQVAAWLAEQGARHVALLGRKAPADAAREAIRALEARGVKVATLQGDVTAQRSLADALAGIPRDFPLLRGVVHAAGVLDDHLLFNMDLQQLQRAMAPKVDGAWNLHVLTRREELDFFVLFSSVACVLGSPGQANYAAGNAFLDGLACYRRQQGLPATSINWGPWANSGMAAEAGRGAQIESRGMALIPADKGLQVLAGLLRSRPTNVAVMDAHWADMRKAMRGRTATILRQVDSGDVAATAEPAASKVDHAFRQKLLGVDLPARQTLLRTYFAEELARIMAIEPAQIDVQQPLNTLGLDSLMAIELKNNLETRLAISLPMALFLEGPSVSSLADSAGTLISDEPAKETANGEAAAGGTSASVTKTGEKGQPGGWTPLLVLQRHGEKAPLFCIHPVGGDVRCYYDFARAMPDRPVYTIRARGMEGVEPPHDAMPAMVADYVAVVRGVQPSGPYHLAGWSTGGIFAYGMASLLRQQGAAVAPLLMFDSPTPAILRDVDLDDDAQFLYDLVNFSNRFAGAAMQVSYEALRAQNPQERLQTTLEEAKRHGVIPAEVSIGQLRRMIDVARAHVRAAMHYVPTPLDVPLCIFRPLEGELLAEVSGQHVEGDLGWGPFASQIQLRQVSGDHFTMMVGENGRSLARLVGPSLEDRAASGSG